MGWGFIVSQDHLLKHVCNICRCFRQGKCRQAHLFIAREKQAQLEAEVKWPRKLRPWSGMYKCRKFLHRL